MGDEERETRYCGRCGLNADCVPGGMPEGWSFSFEDGRTVFTCPTCVRSNIRAIEGKLPEEWWE
jgi:hypothetical protein